LDAVIATPSLSVEDLYLVTNAAFHSHFLDWALRHGVPCSHIANDASVTNETRLGAVADIAFAVRLFDLRDHDLLVIGGDTLFLRDFSLTEALERFRALDGNDGCLVTAYRVSTQADVKTHGIVTLDKSRGNLIVAFHEKPMPHETSSRFACPCFYFLRKNVLPLMDEFLADSECKGEPLEARDATGKFLAWAVQKRKGKFHAMDVEGRIDVGGLRSYLDACKYFN
jgi:dTDP-glucose pyrophosphorylase